MEINHHNELYFSQQRKEENRDAVSQTYKNGAREIF